MQCNANIHCGRTHVQSIVFGQRVPGLQPVKPHYAAQRPLYGQSRNNNELLVVLPVHIKCFYIVYLKACAAIWVCFDARWHDGCHVAREGGVRQGA